MSSKSWRLAALHLGKPKHAAHVQKARAQRSSRVRRARAAHVWRADVVVATCCAQIAETQRQRQALKREAAAAAAPPLPRSVKLRSPVRAREQKRAAVAAANAADSLARARSLPLLAPARPKEMSKEDIEEYQADLRQYRTLRKQLQARPLPVAPACAAALH